MEEPPKIHTLEDFEPLVGQNFTLAQEGLDETIEGELVEARASAFEAAPKAIRAPFDLLFRLDPQYAPDQCLCTISHEAIGAVVLLLVPIEEKEDGYYMEAIMN